MPRPRSSRRACIITYDPDTGELEDFTLTATFQRESRLMRMDVLSDVRRAVEREYAHLMQEWHTEDERE